MDQIKNTTFWYICRVGRLRFLYFNECECFGKRFIRSPLLFHFIRAVIRALADHQCFIGE